MVKNLTSVEDASCFILKILNCHLTAKNRINEIYRKELININNIELQKEFCNRKSICWTFSVLLNDELSTNGRDEIIDKLLLNGIESRPIFYPLHQMPPNNQAEEENGYENSMEIAKRGIVA